MEVQSHHHPAWLFSRYPCCLCAPQGSYMFHCHNLVHEDQGLMGAINSTSAPGHRGRGSDPGIPDPVTFMDPAVLDDERYGRYDEAPHSLPYFEGPDPLVADQDTNPDVGHNLYAPMTMPASAMRHDPDHPGWPQPITTSLLQSILDRGYYKAFYPGGRRLWQEPSSRNPFAIRCPRPRASGVVSATPNPTPSPATSNPPSPTPSPDEGPSPVTSVLPLTATACANGGPSNLTIGESQVAAACAIIVACPAS
jgi:hypothetical protein